MEILLEALGPGVHRYSPFRKPAASKNAADVRLSELCKNRILRSVTLRRLSAAASELPLPGRLLRYVADLTTADFEKIEIAPFSLDAFSLNFLHRALTYRVVCLLDGFEYMLTFGYSPVEEAALRVEHRAWVDLQHPNVLRICATARDPHTDNVFYVFDQPRISLDRMCSVFRDRNLTVPEGFLWRLASDLCEALRSILTKGLQYRPFWLENVFVVEDRLVLENGLMRKGVAKEERGENVLCDVISILKHLAPDCDRSESLLEFVREVEKEDSIDDVIDRVHKRNMDSFSFGKLIRSLKDGGYPFDNFPVNT